MHADLDTPAAPPRRKATGVAGHLRQAILALTDGMGEIVRHSEKPWASITFEGSRHTLGIVFDGADAVAAGEALIAALPDHEFAVPGQLVAEATVTAADHVMLPRPRLSLTCEILLLKDC